MSNYPDDYGQGPPGGREDYYPPPTSASRRTNLPGISLMVVAVLNLLGSFYHLGSAAYTASLSKEQIAEVIRQQAKLYGQFSPEIGKQMEQRANTDADSFRTQSLVVSGLWGAVLLVGSIVSFLGGLRMRTLRSYGLAVTGAVAAAVPFVSCMGCCGVGEVVGIWALVVLLNPDVKAAFDRPSAPPDYRDHPGPAPERFNQPGPPYPEPPADYPGPNG